VRPGLTHLALIAPNKTNVGQLPAHPAHLQSFDLLGLMELKSVSCLCGLLVLNASRCLGCCRPLCWQAL